MFRTDSLDGRREYGLLTGLDATERIVPPGLSIRRFCLQVPGAHHKSPGQGGLLLRRQHQLPDRSANDLYFARLRASAAENPQGSTRLGPPPFLTTATG